LIEIDIPARDRRRFRGLIDDITGHDDASAGTPASIKRILGIIGEIEDFIHENT
jgi:hypothetical protein